MKDKNKMFLNIMTKTSGTGHWTRVAKDVLIKKMILDDFSLPVGDETEEDFEPMDCGSLDVYFDLKTWTHHQHGLIYTDPLWIETFKSGLIAKGFSPESLEGVHYSEQGMQWKTYVNLDVDMNFINEFRRLHPNK